MPYNNIKALDAEQKHEFDKKYYFVYDEKTDEVVVRYRRKIGECRHPANREFVLNTKIKKFTFTPEAIRRWKKDTSRSLIEVQESVYEQKHKKERKTKK